MERQAAQAKTQDTVKQKLLDKKDGFLQASKIITKEDIRDTLKRTVNTYDDVMTIVNSLDPKYYLKEVLDSILTPFLLERLSVFAEFYPNVFERHVFCGWLSGLVAKQLKLDEQQIKDTVMAGFARDIGLLYLPEVLLDEKARFGPSEWNAMKTHPLVGEIIARDIGNFSPEVTRAIVEHHERHDGMGYPRGLKGKSLSIIGQIVGAVDTIGAIRFKRFEFSGRNLRDVFAYIQMNENQFDPDVNGALFNILVKTGIQKSVVNPFKTVEKLVSHLYVRGAAMNGAIHLMEKLNDALAFFEQGPKRKALIKTNQQVMKLIHQSGVLDKEMLDWLNQMDKDYDYRQVDIAELSEMELLQNELYYHLKRVSDVLRIFHDEEMNKRNPSAQVVSTVLQCLSEKNLPRAAQSIR